MNDMGTEENKTESTPASPEGGVTLEAGELEALVAERDRLRDAMLRTQAEFDNFRKRTAKEKKETGRAASAHVIRELLPVLDGLELALKSPGDADSEMRRGVDLLLKQFRETLEKMGLKAVPAAGAPFDPHIHHAVEMVETEEHPDHTVMEEYQRGYFFQDHLLRPAMVRVAVHPRKGE